MTDITTVETQKDIGTDQDAKVRRWLLELKLASKEEKPWRENCEKIWNKYRAKDQKKKQLQYSLVEH